MAKHFALFDEVYKTTDGGTTFTATTLTDQVTFNTVNITEIYSIDFYDANNGVAACSANCTPFIARTTDGGQTWIQDTIANSILTQSSGFSGFKPIQMVTPDAAFTQIVVNTSKRYIIGFGIAEGSSDTTTNPNPTDAIAKNLESKVSIYPNPVFFGNLTIEAEGHYNVNIYNANGQLIKTELNLNNKSEISLNDINAGLYIIQINGKDNNTTQKLIIK